MSDEGGRVPTVHLMIPTGGRVTYDVTKDTTISDLIVRIRSDPAISNPPDRTISLIYRGRVLNEAEKVCEIDSLDEFTIHVFYRAVRSPEAPPPPVNSELRGFDRLLRMNYSQNEISDLRHRFHSMHGTLDATGDARLELEEEWFPVIFNQENPLEDLRIRRGNDGRENTTPLDPIEEEEIPPSFLQFLTGLTVGVLLGVPALALVAIGQVLETRLRDRWFLAGALAGSCGHYLMRMLLGYM